MVRRRKHQILQNEESISNEKYTTNKSINNNNEENKDPIKTKTLNQTIHSLLNELNHNGARVNECSKKKSHLLIELQKEMDKINEFNTIPVLNKYFEILFHLERCQIKIEQHQLEKSDIWTEMFMTQQIIMNMVQMKRQKNKSLMVGLKQNLLKLNKKFNNKNDNNGNSSSTSLVFKLLGEKPSASASPTRKLFKKHRNCSLHSQTSSFRTPLIPNDDPETVAEDYNDNKDNNHHQKLSTKLNDEKENESSKVLMMSNNLADPYIETVKHLKSKLSILRKHRQLNENCLCDLTTEFSSLKKQLKIFYQEHYQELLEHQTILDRYFRYRVHAQEIQTKVNLLDESIREYRLRYRETMNKIRVLSYQIHQSEQNLLKSNSNSSTTTTTTTEAA